jgi:hypothetical protein
MTMHTDDDLDIGGGGGVFVPYLKFNAKTKQWTWRGEDGEVELSSTPTFAWDLANIATGWFRFTEGSPPDRVIDGSEGRAPRPSEQHKRGFVSKVYGRSVFVGTGEFSATAVGLCEAVREVYREFRATQADHPGQVPVVTVTGTSSFKGRFGTNHAPVFKIARWVDRPAELPDELPVPKDEEARPVRNGAAAPVDHFDDLDDSIPF